MDSMRTDDSRRRRLPWLAVVLAGSVYFALLHECRAVTLTMLPIGDVGNAIDPRPFANLGTVEYRYWLDKYDVTNAQYAEFLNAKAINADPFGLYAADMSVNPNGGITRSVNAPFTYNPKAGMANKPVVFVSWYDALRFTN
jgi:formylglycine-generating enzyme